MSQEETAVPKAAGLSHGGVSGVAWTATRGSQEWPGMPHGGLRSSLISRRVLCL